MSAEGPVRKPTSEPPDVDSLMSRLDGDGASDESSSEPPSDPGVPASDRGRRSAPDLLSGRGRRSKRSIRVPDDAVPAASPPAAPLKRSAPPAAPPAVAESLLKAPSLFPEVVAVRPQRIINVGGPAPTREPTPPREPAASAPVPSSEPTPIAPQVAAIAPGVLAPLLDPVGPMPAVGSSSDLQALGTPPVPAPPDPTPATPPVAPPRRSMPPPPPVRTPAPFASPFAQPPAPAPTFAQPPAPAPTFAQPPAPAPTFVQPPASAPTPESASVPTTPNVTLPNLDVQVREALALLERDDFESSIDINVQVEEALVPGGPPSEESLGDDELEVVERPVPSRKAPPAPNPPPRRQSLPATGMPTSSASAPPPPAPAHTLPSAAPAEPTSQPTIVVAAAATAVSGPSAGAGITQPPQSTPTPTAPPVEAAEVRKKKRQWFEELFNDDFARTLPRVDRRYLDREVSFIEDSLGCDKGATVLDLGCGPGEHAVALASRGYEVIGVDLSLAMLARASDEAAERGQRINFLQGDMRDLTFDEAFDGIYCFNTTFGYFDDAKNAEVIQKIHRALRRGGRFLLDVANRDYVTPRTPSMVWFQGDGCVCMDDVQLNGLNSRLVVKRTMMMEDGRQREIEYQIRLYALHELGKLLHDSGFRVAEVSGDTSTPGSYFGAESPRILILAEKR
jgi:SAM-dependent methyltransferase